MKRYCLCICVFLVACSSQPKTKQEVKSTNDASAPKMSADAALLAKGAELTTAGSLRDAINSYFDPVIQHCQQKYSEDKKVYFSARSQLETITYALMGVSLKKDVEVLDSTCGNAYFLKGYALVDLGQLDEAAINFKKAVQWSPKNSMYLSELGNIYQTKKDWKNSLDYFTQAEDSATFTPEKIKNQELARAKRGVGFNLTELGKFDEAEKKYQECLAIDKNDKIAQSELNYIKQLRKK